MCYSGMLDLEQGSQIGGRGARSGPSHHFMQPDSESLEIAVLM